MSELRLCAGPMCSNMEDPRWGGFCDGCGVSSEEEALSLKQRYRETNAIVRQLLDDVRGYLLECKRDAYNNQLLARINEALEPQPQTEVSK